MCLMVAKRLILFDQGVEQGPVRSEMGEVSLRGRYESSVGDRPTQRMIRVRVVNFTPLRLAQR